MNSKNIADECEWCGETYCVECSDAKQPFHFCSFKCEDLGSDEDDDE